MLRTWKSLFSTHLTPTVVINTHKKLYPYRSGTALEAVILDLSGTTMDAYVLAPIYAFKKVFQSEGLLNVTADEIRKPMGLRLDLHIRKILETPSIQKKFIEAKGDLEARTNKRYVE
jgi:beta-phosphoglucomutase-like phosphatase (HAD superfamily)